MICHGEGCFATFTEVTFRSTTVVVVSGAGVRFEGCTFDNSCTRRAAGVAVLAHGVGSKVVMEHSSIKGGAQVRGHFSASSFKSSLLRNVLAQGELSLLVALRVYLVLSSDFFHVTPEN